ncbi:serine hydrolase [Actinomadura fibrosa]|uniref:Serine hydrolase n=1 Tax=Actinomadura fibrosa TaxID=111802 RepID=A0ABW2XEV5_9ACTN|nr:serine hydrolase [Actinomadura fibrosa]
MPEHLFRSLFVVVSTGVALSAAVPAAAEPSPPAAARPCHSSGHPAAARRLGARIRAALAGRAGTESVAVRDRRRGIVCAVQGDRRYDSASVVKVTILGALLHRAASERRALAAFERDLARRMITQSDNAAASALWRSVGRARIQRFVERAGMARTTLGPTGFWGLTQITARDELRLLDLLTAHNALLPDKARAYALKLMGEVVPSQNWGTPTGRPPGIDWHVKNGWLPRHDRYWRVHSIGAFDGHGEDYSIVVLTQDTPSMAYGVRTIERVAGVIHEACGPDARSAMRGSVPDGTWERSDGSVPSGA